MQTQFNVLDNELSAIVADKAVISRQAEEGAVTAPASGRVLSVPVTTGSVVLPGETIARIAGGGYFLRLMLPERHAAGITEGDPVIVGARGLLPQGDDNRTLTGTVAKVYPEIREGRVTADVEVEGLGDFFVGERTLVSIPIGMRRTIAVPDNAVVTRHGIDYVTVRRNGVLADVSVVPGERLENGSGFACGDSDRPVLPVIWLWCHESGDRRATDPTVYYIAAGAAVFCSRRSPLAWSHWSTLPREEEPQISVPMVDVHVQANGPEGRGRGRTCHRTARDHPEIRRWHRASLLAKPTMTG